MSEINYKYYGEVSDRIKVIASYLKGKTEGKNIVDLNCGSAPLYDLLKKDYKVYVGNDICYKKPMFRGSNFVILPMTDEDLSKMAPDCNILLNLGVGGYEITKAEAESKTATASINKIIDARNPELVVVECVEKFLPILSNYKLENYVLDFSDNLDLGEAWTHKRCIRIWKKKI